MILAGSVEEGHFHDGVFLLRPIITHSKYSDIAELPDKRSREHKRVNIQKHAELQIHIGPYISNFWLVLVIVIGNC